MIRSLKLKSELSRNVLTLMTGTTIAQAIPIAITPILTRIYTPEDFGVLALFVAVIVILGSVANGRYELAIMLPEADEDAVNIAALGLLIAVIFSFMLLIPVVMFNKEIASLLDNQEITFWLYFIPFVVLMMGLYNILNYLNTRKKLYKDIARTTIYRSIVSAMLQIGIGSFKSGVTGLISGQIASQIVANVRLVKNTKLNYNLKTITREKIKTLAFRYRDFPLFSSWGSLANNLSIYLINILISIFYSVATLGFLTLAQKMLLFPSVIIGSAFGQVFYQEATNEKQKTGAAVNSYNSTLKKLVLISISFFVPLYFFIEEIFVFVFGENWRLAGIYAMILLPLFAVQFISSTLSVIFNVFEKQKLALIWQVVLLINTVGVLLISKWLDWDFESFLYLFSSYIGIQYVIYGYVSFKISKGSKGS